MAPLATAFVRVAPNMLQFPSQAAAGIAAARLGAAGAAQGAAFGKAFGTSAKSLMIVGFGAGLGLLLKASVEAAGDFEAQMVRLVTSAGETGTLVSGNLKVVAEGIKQMAGPVGTSLEALGKAMYTVESGSFHGAAALKVLQAAAEGAKAEGADLTKVTNAVTTALVDYHLDADQAAFVTTKLVAATAAGKTTFEQLTGALHSVLPIASAAGISLEDILGSLASMTLHGVSAEQATQNLADVIRHMINPTALQAKELALLGLTTTQLADDLKTKGLSGTLGEISDRIRKLMPPGSDKVILDLRTALNSLSPTVRALGMRMVEGTMTASDLKKEYLNLDVVSRAQLKSFAALAGTTHRIGDTQMTGTKTMQTYGQALARATGDATGLAVALMLTGDNAGQTSTAVAAVTAATTEAGNHVKGWGEIQQTFNYKLASFHASVGVLKVALGESLLPILGRITEAVTSAIGPMTSWINEHQRATAIIAGSTAGLAAFTAAVLITAKLVGAIQALAVALRLAAIAQGAFTAAVTVFNVVTSWTLIQVVALIAWSKIAAVATKVWAAGQWLLNAALSANPIGLIVIAVAALVLGFIYAYKHSATFRAIVQGALHAVAAAGIWMWHHVLKPVFEALVVAWHAVAAAALWLWHTVIEPVVHGIAAAATWLYQHVIKPVVGFVAAEMRLWGTVTLWLWHNIIDPFFGAMGRIYTAIWIVVQIAVKIIWAQLQMWGTAALWLWHTIIEPFAHGIAAAFMWLWNTAIKPWAAEVVAKIHLVADFALWLWHTIIEPFAHGIAAAFMWLWNNGIKPWAAEVVAKFQLVWLAVKLIFELLKDWILVKLPAAFHAGVEGITKAWDKVREAARVPVAFVVNQVINPAIRGFNKIADFFGVKTRVEEIKGFAGGGHFDGMLPGPPSDVDNLLARGPRGQLIGLAGGEFVVNAEKTARNRTLLQMINDGQVEGFADGGIIDFGKDLWKIITNPKKLITDAVNGLLGKVPGGGTIRDIVIGAARKVADQMVSWVTGRSSSGGGTGSGPGFGSWPSSPSAQRGDSGVWRSIVALIQSTGPLSGSFGNAYRAGDPLWHGSGRAVDWMGVNQDALATFLSLRNPLELIHRTNTRDYAYTRGVNKGSFNNALMTAHRNHIHIAMARGGLLNFDAGGTWPSGTVGINTSGRTEHVTTGSGMDRIERLLERQNALIERLIDAVEYVAPGVGRELRGATRGALQVARAR